MTVHSGRPAGVNRPTHEGVEGARRILSLVKQANDRTVVIGLISGGGSALLPLPVDGVSIEEKSKLTGFLSDAGATIDELNLIRKSLSKIKGGGLVQDFKGHSFHNLIISDVMGNPLDTIASGPTVGCDIDYRQVLLLLKKYDPDRANIPSSVYQWIDSQADSLPVKSAAIVALEFRFTFLEERINALFKVVSPLQLGLQRCFHIKCACPVAGGRLPHYLLGSCQ